MKINPIYSGLMTVKGQDAIYVVALKRSDFEHLMKCNAECEAREAKEALKKKRETIYRDGDMAYVHPMIEKAMIWLGNAGMPGNVALKALGFESMTVWPDGEPGRFYGDLDAWKPKVPDKDWHLLTKWMCPDHGMEAILVLPTTPFAEALLRG
jgi:hypothetical protein